MVFKIHIDFFLQLVFIASLLRLKQKSLSVPYRLVFIEIELKFIEVILNTNLFSVRFLHEIEVN